jgi:hypothetical protein
MDGAGVIRVQIPVRYRVWKCRGADAPHAHGPHWVVERGPQTIAIPTTFSAAHEAVRRDLDRRTK